MTIDIRANVQSTLGPVISANISDDYIQGNGLIKTRGSCVIAGLVNPKIGTPFKIRYTKNGITRQIPRTLRVLSSFADPFRRTTSLQLGCKLTYMEDTSDAIRWTAIQDRESNADYTEKDAEYIIIPMYAAAIMKRCLRLIDITTASIPLTNVYSVAEFDFSPGYVQIINDLLVSESYCGYLNPNEELVIFSLNQDGGTGPLISSQDVIDIGEINVGQIPGEAVIVNYNNFTTKATNNSAIAPVPPDEPEEPPPPEEPEPPTPPEEPQEELEIPSIYRTEEPDPFTGFVSNESWNISEVAISYKDRIEGSEELESAIFSAVKGSIEETFYEETSVIDRDTVGAFYLQEIQRPYFASTEWDYIPLPIQTKQISLAKKRFVLDKYSACLALGGVMADMLSIRINPANNNLRDLTEETFYYNEFGEEYLKVLEKTTSFANFCGSTGLTTVYEQLDSNGNLKWVRAVPLDVPVPAERVETWTYVSGNYSKVVTYKYIPWLYTIQGQQTVAAVSELCSSAQDVVDIWLLILSLSYELVLSETNIQVQVGQPSPQRGPTRVERLKRELTRQDDKAKPSEEYNKPEQTEVELDQRGSSSYELTSQGGVQLISGSPTAKRRVEFTMPYASDDSFYKLGLTYYIKSSDAPEKSKLFGLVQNRLLLGNRNGINIQTAPEKLPSAPFAPLYINMAGTAALYRTNGTSWTIDGNGVIVSTDALYWGLAGKLQ